MIREIGEIKSKSILSDNVRKYTFFIFFHLKKAFKTKENKTRLFDNKNAKIFT